LSLLCSCTNHYQLAFIPTPWQQSQHTAHVLLLFLDHQYRHLHRSQIDPFDVHHLVPRISSLIYSVMLVPMFLLSTYLSSCTGQIVFVVIFCCLPFYSWLKTHVFHTAFFPWDCPGWLGLDLLKLVVFDFSFSLVIFRLR